MSQFDLEYLEQRYDHDLVVLLESLNRVDLKQFAADLKTNNKKLFSELTIALNKESDNAFRS